MRLKSLVSRAADWASMMAIVLVMVLGAGIEILRRTRKKAQALGSLTRFYGPVFQRNGKWYFYHRGMKEEGGPFRTRADACQAYETYLAWFEEHELVFR